MRMDGVALIAAAALMGLAGLPHCAAMCAAPCAALTRGNGMSHVLFQSARIGGYAAAVGAGANVLVFGRIEIAGSMTPGCPLAVVLACPVPAKPLK